MARPKIVAKYPLYLMDILDVLRDDPTQPVVLLYASQKIARSAQMNFIAFRNACEAEGMHKGKDLPNPTLDDAKQLYHKKAEYPDLLAYITRVHPIADSEHWRLEVWHMDYTPEALGGQAQMDKIKQDRRET